MEYGSTKIIKDFREKEKSGKVDFDYVEKFNIDGRSSGIYSANGQVIDVEMTTRYTTFTAKKNWGEECTRIQNCDDTETLIDMVEKVAFDLFWGWDCLPYSIWKKQKEKGEL